MKKNIGISILSLVVIFSVGCSWLQGKKSISEKENIVGRNYTISVKEKRKLTFSSSYDYSPVWGKRGEEIFFKSIYDDGRESISRIDADGSNRAALFFIAKVKKDISCGFDWNDRRQQFAFIQEERFIGAISSELWLFDRAKKQKERLTADFFSISYPSWSLDGEHLIFVSTKDGSPDIWSADRHGRGMVNITRDKRENNQPVWSPDRKFIAFSSREDTTDRFDLWIMRSDGTKKKKLTSSESTGWRYHEPHFSPDGEKIVFYAGTDTGQKIFVMNRDGSQMTALTEGKYADYHPKWSPDGTKIIFARQTKKGSSIWVLKLARGNMDSVAKIDF